jgi:protein SCO1/2
MKSAMRRCVLALLAGGSLNWHRRAAASAPARYSDGVVAKTVQPGAVPPVPVVSMHGRPTILDRELDAAPVVLNFIFTTCSSTCSMQTAVLAELQRQCLERGKPIRLVSVTIDPDNDTQEQLQRFAASFKVRPGWQFLTGRFDDLLLAQRHFDVYRGSKAAHPPVVLMRGASKSAWTRVEGIASAKDLLLALDSLGRAGA